MSIVIKDLVFSYPDRPVFSGLSLTLSAPVTALSAPSGRGKTTLLRLLAGLEQPQSGSITAPPPAETAILFQEDRLFPGMTPAAQVRSVLPRGEDPLPWLDAVGLLPQAENPLSTLSGGMKRRLALTRCLAYGQKKQLLLLDEPFAGVDAERAASIMAFIRTLRIPVVFSAHDSESLALADEVCVL